MAIRVDSTSFAGTGICVGGTGLGVKGSVIRATTATGTYGSGLLYDDWDDSSDDNKELRAFITSWPAGLTLFVHEDGSFAASGADGSYTIGYRLDKDGVSQGTTSETVNIGALTATSDLVASYDIRAAAQKDLSASFSISQYVQQDLAAAYSLRAAVSADLLATFDVEVAGTVSADLIAVYVVREAIASDMPAAYSLLAAVQKDLAAEFAIKTGVQADLEGAWSVLGSAQADLSASWAVAGSVSKDLTATYQVFASSGGGGASVEEIWAHVLPNGMSAQDTLVALHAMVIDLYRIHGLQPGTPLVVTPTSRQAGAVEQTVSKVGDTVTVERV